MLLSIILSLILAAPPDIPLELSDAIQSLSYESEGSDELKLLIIPPESKSLDASTRVAYWAAELDDDERPDCPECVEEESFDGFFRQRIEPREWHSDYEIENSARWQALASLMRAKLKTPSVFYVGEAESYKVVVVVGYDKRNNLVGFWAREWWS